jgi:hypothetical protein
LVADDPFLAIERVFGKTSEQNFRDQILRENVNLELDVMRGRGIDDAWFAEMNAEEVAGGASGFNCDGQRFGHAPNLTDSAPPPRRILAGKKSGRRN